MLAPVYFNEFDRHAAQWLRNLIAEGLIPRGEVDGRDIRDVDAGDLVGYRACHWFAGIAGWCEALRLAGWPDGREVWTASCPCQPFSSAGKRKGEADHRHVWPELFRLVRERRPQCLIGEQVASPDGLRWFDGVSADLEGEGYAVGAVDLCAAGVGAPHIRQRLFWVADAGRASLRDERQPMGGTPRRDQGDRHQRERIRDDFGNGGDVGGLADDEGERRRQGARAVEERPGLADHGEAKRLGNSAGWRDGPLSFGGSLGPREAAGRVGRAGGSGSARGMDDSASDRTERRRTAKPQGNGPDDGVPVATSRNDWSDFALVPCHDGKARRIGAQPGDEPLAHGIPSKRSDPRLGQLLAELGKLGHGPKAARQVVREARANRIGRLRGYGNAILPTVGALFVKAYMAARGIEPEAQ